jgi:hypothetical protein
MNPNDFDPKSQKKKQVRDYKKISCVTHIGFQVQTSKPNKLWQNLPMMQSSSFVGWVGPTNAKDQLKIMHYG